MKRLLLIMILSTFVFISLLSATKESLTYDEGVHVQVGMDAWRTQTFTKDPFSPPLIAELAVIPKLLNLDQLIPSPTPSMKMFPSRMVILFLSVCLMIALYRAVKRMIGEPEAIVSVFLFAWEPSILAHSHLVTKDMGFTLFFFLTWMFFLSLCKKYQRKTFIGFSLLLGCLLAAKTSAIPFFVCSIFALIILDRSYWQKMMKVGWRWVLSGVIALFVVWMSYFFQTDVIIARRDDPKRVSSRLMKYAQETNNALLTSILNMGTSMKIPLGTYIASQKNGLLLQKEQGIVFFLGTEYAGVRWYMLPVNFLLKLPIPLILFCCTSLYWLWKKQLQTQKYIPFLAPIIGITVFLCISHVKPYVRYVLPIYPFLFILSGAGLIRMIKKNWLIVPVILCIWYTIGTLLYFPHFISFANVLSGPREKRYEKLIDSDIDWGQGLFDVAAYMKKNAISTLSFSYFGTDDGALYGLPSTTPFGSHTFEDICSFHEISGPTADGQSLTAISISNWYYCGYNKIQKYEKNNIKSVLEDATLIFR